MSLSDQLLNDLNDSEGDYEFEADEAVKKELPDESEVDGAAAVTARDPFEQKLKIESCDYNSVSEVAKLKNSERLHSILNKIEGLRNPNLDSGPKASQIESSNKNERNEYEQTVVVEANNLAADIDVELITIYRFTRTKYQKRFPELESLVVAPIDYMLTVRELGNDLDQAKNNENLQKFLTQATIMVVSMTASTTQGVRLSAAEKAQIDEACQMAIELNEIKEMILDYVASKMSLVAPNLSAIVGPSIAAKLISIEGGLTKLTTTPACNILLIGKEKKNLSGFSKITVLPNTGYVYYCDLVQKAPPELRRKAARYVANKCAMAVRIDRYGQSLNSERGEAFREQILKKLDKLQEPPPVKFVKPLPKPIEAPKKRRGGKRVRKMKERYAVTELRKNANRLNFADIDEDAYQDDLSYDRGTIGKATSGRIRMPQIDKKTKVRISKTLQKNLQKEQAWGGGVTSIRKTAAASGTASSISFTPLQGFEIVNPQAAEKKFEVNNKYFATTSGFASAKK